MNVEQINEPQVIQDLKELSKDLPKVDLNLVEKKVLDLTKLASNEKEIYDEMIEICKAKFVVHPSWLLLAGRVKMKFLKKSIPPTFGETTRILKNVLDEEYYNFVMENEEELNKMIIEENDYTFKIFGLETLMDGRLASVWENNEPRIVETPQYAYLRIAVFLWYPGKRGFGSMVKIRELYGRYSRGEESPASPVIMNAGMIRPQLSSCFTMDIEDNMKSISTSWMRVGNISMNCGGVGIDFSSLRHSEIKQHGKTKGVVPWIKIIEQILKVVDQGDRRKGSGTAYLSDWHIDIEDFVDLRKAGGNPEMRAQGMTFDVWISDEFMRRVEKDQEWTLFCPNKAKNLEKKWGVDFEMAYLSYEKKAKEGKITHFRTIRARDLWKRIILAQIETGMPFIHYKDACNRKCNQNNLGTIRLSNLCCEILGYTDENTIMSCNLGSISLNTCVKEGEIEPYYFDFDMLGKITENLVKDLNQVIDRNYYPPDIPQIEETNLRNRPLGIGIQGLADALAMLDMSWLSQDAKRFNEMVAETMYYHAMKASVDLAVLQGHYESFEGSTTSKGLFQFDLWDLEKIEKEFAENTGDPLEILKKQSSRGPATDRYDWESLRKDMVKYGLRNSMLIALMPTASSSNVLGNNECFEPYTSHIYARTINSGQFMMINEHLVRDMENIDLWNTETVRNIWENRGSILQISEEGLDPQKKIRLQYLKEKYLTAFELPQKRLAEMMLDRGRYVCQTQSFNCYMKDPTYAKLNAFHFYNWSNGAPTGMYYLHQSAKIDPTNFSLDTIVVPEKKNGVVCDDDICIACSM